MGQPNRAAPATGRAGPGARPEQAAEHGEAAQRLYAERAQRAYAAMQRSFARADGAYRREGLPGRLGTLAHLWPFARAFVAALDIAGIDPPLRPGFDADAEITRHLAVLERYWAQPPGRLPAYASDPPGSRFGGDRYHDDNAWVALALIELERLRRDGRGPAAPPAPPGPAAADPLARAEQLWRFALAGWDDSPAGGGVFWVEQGVGIGKRNHDRNTVTCAPNAEVALHLAELGVPITTEPVGPEQMFTWVVTHLDAGGDGNGLFRDKIRGDGTIDLALWSYNQGSMLGAAALLARRAAAAGQEHEASEWANRAHEIARRAQRSFGGAAAFHDPPEFMAIMFRNLLLLHGTAAGAGRLQHGTAAGAGRLQHGTAAAAGQQPAVGARAMMRAYGDAAWARFRDRDDRFRFPGRGHTLLGQSAMVQIFALLAWEPERYRLLA